MRRYSDEGAPDTLLAGFGDARLMHHLDGRLELVGGTELDRTTALDWLRRFLPEARLGGGSQCPGRKGSDPAPPF